MYRQCLVCGDIRSIFQTVSGFVLRCFHASAPPLEHPSSEWRCEVSYSVSVRKLLEAVVPVLSSLCPRCSGNSVSKITNMMLRPKKGQVIPGYLPEQRFLWEAKNQVIVTKSLQPDMPLPPSAQTICRKNPSTGIVLVPSMHTFTNCRGEEEAP